MRNTCFLFTFLKIYSDLNTSSFRVYKNLFQSTSKILIRFARTRDVTSSPFRSWHATSWRVSGSLIIKARERKRQTELCGFETVRLPHNFPSLYLSLLTFSLYIYYILELSTRSLYSCRFILSGCEMWLYILPFSLSKASLLQITSCCILFLILGVRNVSLPIWREEFDGC